MDEQEIETRHIKILETIFKGSRFETTDLRLREAAPGVVIAHLFWNVSNEPKPGKDPIKGLFTHVFVKNHGKWEITATQNTLIAN